MNSAMHEKLRITGRAVYDELVARSIDVEIIDAHTGLLKFVHNGNTRYVQSCLTDDSSPIGRNIADHKASASKVASSLGLQMPAERFYSDTAAAAQFIEEHKTIVVKPNDGAHGKGVTVDVTSINQLAGALQDSAVASKTKKILLQQQIDGLDVRVLVIDGVLAAASLRSPAAVVGDGHHTIEELVHIENDNPLRGTNYNKPLNRIDVGAAARYVGYTFETAVPKKGEEVRVAGTANIGTGGKATDITNLIPNDIVEQSVRIALELRQKCCGVDFIASDIADAKTYYFIEINASPSFGLHMKPSEGESRAVHRQFVDMLLR